MFISLAERVDHDLILIVQGHTQVLSHVSIKMKYSHLMQQLPPNTSGTWQEVGWSKFICRLNNSNCVIRYFQGISWGSLITRKEINAASHHSQENVLVILSFSIHF